MQTQRSMEQKRELKNKSIHGWSFNLLQRNQYYIMTQWKCSINSVWLHWTVTWKRMQLEYYLTPYTINSKWIKGLNIRPEIKKTIKKMKRKYIEWEKIFANYIADNRRIPKIHKELIELNTKKKRPSIKWPDLNRYFSKEDIQVQEKMVYTIHQFRSVQSLSHARVLATPWIIACQAPLSIIISWSSFKFTSIESVMPSSHLILCHPLFLLPLIPPSIRVFSNESTLCMRLPEYWSFSFSIIPSKEHPGLIFFRMDWLDLLAVQGTLKSLLQHHSSKESIFQRSAFFTVQLAHPYMITGKNHSLD